MPQLVRFDLLVRGPFRRIALARGADTELARTLAEETAPQTADQLTDAIEDLREAVAGSAMQLGVPVVDAIVYRQVHADRGATLARMALAETVAQHVRSTGTGRRQQREQCDALLADVVQLSQSFDNRYATPTAPGVERMMAHGWAQAVREAYDEIFMMAQPPKRSFRRSSASTSAMARIADYFSHGLYDHDQLFEVDMETEGAMFAARDAYLVPPIIDELELIEPMWHAQSQGIVGDGPAAVPGIHRPSVATTTVTYEISSISR